MSHIRPGHLDDFTLLRQAEGETDPAERKAVAEHLAGCAVCRAGHIAAERLQRELRALAGDETVRTDWYPAEFPANDPFSRRPVPSLNLTGPGHRLTFEELDRATTCSERSVGTSEAFLREVEGPTGAMVEALEHLSLSDLGDRLTVLYALQQAGRNVAASPSGSQAFADWVISALSDLVQRMEREEVSEAERVVSLQLLLAQAHQLAGQTRLWTGDVEAAGSHLLNAYLAFGALGDETSMARVEQLEAQRRYFTGHGAEALVLARRAGATFAMLKLEDEHARSRGAEGMALFQLGRWQESSEAFQEAAGVFQAWELWSEYIGALNCVATCLVKLGRLGDVRREYAKALQRLSREHHRSWLPFIRRGLAEALFSAARYREAAAQASRAARLYTESGQISRSLMASLLEAESWARAGDHGRAQHRLEVFRANLASHRSLDPTLTSLIEDALAGTSLDFQEIATLRERADTLLRDRLDLQA